MKKGELTKKRMIETAATLMERQGYHGTGLKQILQESKSPRGSLYFHFPDGKESLAAQAIQHAGCVMREEFATKVQGAQSPADALARIIGVLRDRLIEKEFAAGCPVAAVALEMASESPMLQAVVEEMYREWEKSISYLLCGFGWEREPAEEVAQFALSAIEGAMVLCAAYQSTEPLDRTERQLARLFALPS